MTKMRVHELAKELGIENKELLEILQKKNVEVKNHMSTLEDSVAEEIRREAVAKKDAKASAKEEKPAGQSDTKETPAKKKNLAFVIRPQNSKNSSRIQGSRPPQRQQRPGQLRNADTTEWTPGRGAPDAAGEAGTGSPSGRRTPGTF